MDFTDLLKNSRKVTVESVIDALNPNPFLVQSTEYSPDFSTPVLTAGKTFILGYTDETAGIYPASEQNPVIIFDDFNTMNKWVDFPFKAKSGAMKILVLKDKAIANLSYVYYAMNSLGFTATEHQRHWRSVFSKLQIPLPSLADQIRIADFLDQFNSDVQKAIKLQEEQIKLLKLEKKILLEKIFDNRNFSFNLNGRFFDTSLWQWKKVSEVGVLKRGSDLTKKDKDPEGKYQAVLTGEYFGLSPVYIAPKSRTNGKEKKTFSEGGEILFCGDAEDIEGVMSSFCTIRESGVLLHGGVISPVKDLLNNEFGVLLFRNSRKLLAPLMKGYTISHLYAKDLAKVSIKLPSMQEQRFIAEYFMQLDERIAAAVALYEEQIELIKLEQKIVLEQIFTV